jgi:hypothetical protein
VSLLVLRIESTRVGGGSSCVKRVWRWVELRAESSRVLEGYAQRGRGWVELGRKKN